MSFATSKKVAHIRPLCEFFQSLDHLQDDYTMVLRYISRKLVHLQAAWPAFSQGDQENRRPSVTIVGWAENGRIPDCPSSQAQTGTRKRGPGGRFVSSDAALCWRGSRRR